MLNLSLPVLEYSWAHQNSDPVAEDVVAVGQIVTGRECSAED